MAEPFYIVLDAAGQKNAREALEEALIYLDALNADRQIWYDDYSRLHDLVSSALHEVIHTASPATPTNKENKQ